MKIESLRDLYAEQLQGLYDAEHQLIKALPKMAKAASSEDLRTAFEDHLAKTREHAQRIETIFGRMGLKTRGKKCQAMEGLVKECGAVMKQVMEDGLKDAALIAAAQRVEHYEIAGYGCVRAHATTLGDDVAAAFLAQTLDEEEEADKTLNRIARGLNLMIPKERGPSQGRPEQQAQVAGARSTSAA
ncbi:MAG: ferritin-like domain-containing protein [Terriglobales bacterium]